MINVEQMLADLDVAISECLVIPNEWLPEEWHNETDGGRTLARLEKECDERDEESEHVKLKALKARNIERLRKQVTGHDIDCELDYSENETDKLQLHRNEMAFVGGMLNSGMIEASDLEEE